MHKEDQQTHGKKLIHKEDEHRRFKISCIYKEDEQTLHNKLHA